MEHMLRNTRIGRRSGNIHAILSAIVSHHDRHRSEESGLRGVANRHNYTQLSIRERFRLKVSKQVTVAYGDLIDGFRSEIDPLMLHANVSLCSVIYCSASY
jgi:hypothetical protein